MIVYARRIFSELFRLIFVCYYTILLMLHGWFGHRHRIKDAAISAPNKMESVRLDGELCQDMSFSVMKLMKS